MLWVHVLSSLGVESAPLCWRFMELWSAAALHVLHGVSNPWPACVDFRRAFLMSSSCLFMCLMSSCWVFTSRSFCLSARALRAYSNQAAVWIQKQYESFHANPQINWTYNYYHSHCSPFMSATYFSTQIPASSLNLFLFHITGSSFISSVDCNSPMSWCNTVGNVNTALGRHEP